MTRSFRQDSLTHQVRRNRPAPRERRIHRSVLLPYRTRLDKCAAAAIARLLVGNTSDRGRRRRCPSNGPVHGECEQLRRSRDSVNARIRPITYSAFSISNSRVLFLRGLRPSCHRLLCGCVLRQHRSLRRSWDKLLNPNCERPSPLRARVQP